MDNWKRFVHTGDIRDYLAYKAEEDRAGEIGEKHERPELYGDGNCFICRAGGGI